MKTIHTMVFKAGKGGGNPCPVTLDADTLSSQQMQEITQRYGEEAIFLMSPTRPDCDIRARYFVPLHEMSMCIHATIGAATVLVREERFKKSPIVFETGLGPIQVEWTRNGDQIDVGVMQFLPEYKSDVPSREEVCRALNVTPAQLGDGPILSAATSRFKLIVPLRNKDTVDRLAPDFEYLWTLCDQYDVSGFYPFTLDKSQSTPVCYARQDPNRAGYNEDPATGVAASALGAYLIDQGLIAAKNGWNSCTVYQGEAMGKPSVIFAHTLVENHSIVGTKVSGDAVLE